MLPFILIIFFQRINIVRYSVQILRNNYSSRVLRGPILDPREYEINIYPSLVHVSIYVHRSRRVLRVPGIHTHRRCNEATKKKTQAPIIEDKKLQFSFSVY